MEGHGRGYNGPIKGKSRTIQGMAPVLKFKEAAGDPYLMRQQVNCSLTKLCLKGSYSVS